MQLDWFTLVAQLVNFLILLFLLRRLLYGPITKVMAERQARVTAHLSEAKAREAEADGALVELEQKLHAVEETRKDVLEQAFEEAETTKRDLVKAARAEVEAMRQRWRDTLAKEKDSFLQELQQRVAEEMYGTLRQVLKDLADETLEAQLVRTLVRRLQSLEASERAAFVQALRHTKGSLTVVSAFALTESLQTELKQAVREVFGEGVTLELQRDPTLICGAELLAHDQKLAWTLESYLSGLEAAALKQLAANQPLANEVVLS